MHVARTLFHNCLSTIRIVFPHRKRYLKQGEIISKRFILEKEEFHFGPLHCSKPRERYREGRYPENMEHITINNCGSSEALVNFCFRTDLNASTFLLDPPEMSLLPGESKVNISHINLC